MYAVSTLIDVVFLDKKRNMLYQRRDDYMNVHGKIAIAAIAAALSVGAGAVPAIAEAADAGAAKPAGGR